MQAYMGYIFTEGPVQYLNERGFSFNQTDEGENLGYRSFTCAVSEDAAFQLREILDEQVYATAQNVEKLEPREIQIAANSVVKNKNTVCRIVGTVSEANVGTGPLHDFLKVRKYFKLWALHLECENFETFLSIATPDYIMEWRGKRAAVLHLGPNCFDLVVTDPVPGTLSRNGAAKL